MSVHLRSRCLFVVLLPLACYSSSGTGDDGDGGVDAEPETGDAGPEAADEATEAEPDVVEAGEDGEEDGGEDGEVVEPIDLDPGEVVELAADDDGVFAAALATPGDVREFGLVIYSSKWASGHVGYELTVAGAAPSRVGAAKGSPPPVLRRQADLLERIPGIAADLRRGAVRIARDPLPTPVVGDRRSFQINDPRGGVDTFEAECIAVGEDIAAWMDRTTGDGEDPPADILADVVAGYDGTLLPRERQYFGEESDIDEDGVINYVWSPIVADSGAMAYFSPCDMFDEDALPLGCEYSNEQEILYAAPVSMLPPYMARASAILDTAAHETQHLIYFYRKVTLGGAIGDENAYILEGWAALGEDISGYGRSLVFVAGEALDNSDEFGAYEFLRSGAGYDPDRDGMLRAASYLFIRYLFDRMGGDRAETDGALTDLGGIAWTQAAVNSRYEGLGNFELTLDADIDDLIFDWYTALLLTGRTDAEGDPLPVEPRFTYLPVQTDPLTDAQRGFDPYADFWGMFALTGPHTVSPTEADGELPATGNELVILDWDRTSPTVSLRVTGDPLAELRVRVARLL